MTEFAQQRRLHLVRHGEVHNPTGVLYGRLPGFHLSGLGASMAETTAAHLFDSGRSVDAIFSSPLERAQESAAPVSSVFGLPVGLRSGLIEASSRLEGGRFDVSASILLKPAAWRFLVNPLRPSWGEPYRQVAERMIAELTAAAELEGTGDIVLVSHQLPIWMASRRVRGLPLVHDPRKRRCSLSSVTSFELVDGALAEVDYQEPAASLLARSRDVGAV